MRDRLRLRCPARAKAVCCAGPLTSCVPGDCGNEPWTSGENADRLGLALGGGEMAKFVFSGLGAALRSDLVEGGESDVSGDLENVLTGWAGRLSGWAGWVAQVLRSGCKCSGAQKVRGGRTCLGPP